MNSVNPRVAPCIHCKSLVRIPDDAKPGHRLACAHCDTRYYAWQLLARSYRLETPSHE